MSNGVSPRPGVVHTFQALSEEDRELWLDAMDGKEPMFVHPPKPSDANQTFLDEAGFNFIRRCFHVLESRGGEVDLAHLFEKYTLDT